MKVSEENYLEHYGIIRRSGRYPWGSGKDPFQRARNFQGMLQELRDKGMTDKQIAASLSTPDHPFTVANLRDAVSIASSAAKQADITRAVGLREEGNSPTAIGKIMGRNESSVRGLLEAYDKDKTDVLTATAKMLRSEVDSKTYIDIGSGVENRIGVGKERLRAAASLLKSEGYEVHPVQIDQSGTGPGKKTRTLVLAPPGTKYIDVKKNIDKLRQINEKSGDGGRTFYGMLPPLSIDSSRVRVKYGPEGGAEADGLILVRPGKDDVSLGKARYAQVRVQVDGTHYLKGVAMYSDDLPRGVDLLFHTPKNRTASKKDVMKALRDDPDNPFGAVVDQVGERDAQGRLTKVTSVMNLLNEEGDWSKWSRTLASQTLSKQSSKLAKEQLDMRYEMKKGEFETINAINNPVVKRMLMEKFADSADSSAVHLEAARLPRSAWHVIIPFPGMKNNEIYAPEYDNGERVALIRFPHGGTFEIPELTVNNKYAPAKKALGRAPDAVGINAHVAERMSGADFDGDAVMVIPNDSGRIKTSPALAALENFDPRTKYKGYEGMPKMTDTQKGNEMGRVSNLITDMTIRKASTAEIANAVKHSMVVIDAQNHDLNYKQSEKDHYIPQLMAKYQNSSRGGASTLISRAKGPKYIPEQKLRKFSEGGPVDPKTGELVYVPTGATKTITKVNKRTGEVTTKTDPVLMKSEQLVVARNAHDLSSGTAIEKVYADHSNKLKSLANQARKVAVHEPNIKMDPTAKKVYASEVAELKAALNEVMANRPLERQAQVLAGAIVKQKTQGKDISDDHKKRIESHALTEMRTRTGAAKQDIVFTDKQWEAIQAGAVSTNVLEQLLKKANLDRVRELATPKTTPTMTPAMEARAQSMARLGYTQAEIAKVLGVSPATVRGALSS